ncbi:hypothetical protein Salmuc_00464 [Salipiger mucosus DSM 16094]|uniref:Uncharacterized protein n=1 Tax=Salipiger mucosus DSM 16094 TaxID=1123237 RepID=S9Q9J2_9RHOB|nr:hypothetical protein Salmuc_00464 [Salipiger mucosus DSM 16094]
MLHDALRIERAARRKAQPRVHRVAQRRDLPGLPGARAVARGQRVERRPERAVDARLGLDVVRPVRHRRDVEHGDVVAPGLQDQFHRIEPDQHDEIRLLDRRGLGRAAGEETDARGMILGHDALGLVGGQRRAAQRIDEAPDGVRHARRARLEAQDDHRPSRLRQKVMRLREFRQTGRSGTRSGKAGGRRAARGDAGQLDMHRPLRRGQGKIQKPLDLVSRRVTIETAMPLHDRRAHRRLVEDLMRHVGGERLAEPVGHEHHRRPVERGMREPVHRLRQPRPLGGQRGAGGAGHVGIGRRHHHRRVLGPGQHEGHAQRLGRGNQVEAGAPSGHPVDASRAAQVKRLHEPLGDGPFGHRTPGTEPAET